MKYSWKGHEDRHSHKNRIKKEWASLVGLFEKKKHKNKPQHSHHVKVSPRGLPNKASQGRLCQTGRSRGVYVRQGEAGFAGECAQNKKRHRSRCQTSEAWKSVLIKARQRSLCPPQKKKKKGETGVSMPVNERQGSVFQTPRGKGMYSKQGEAGQSIPSTTCKGSHCQPLTSTPQQQQN